MKLSLVIPAYNEEKIIEAAVQSAVKFLDRNFPSDYELIVVSDGSTDSTRKKLREMMSLYPALRDCGYEKNRGKGCAVRTGILESEGDYAVFTDCDLAYGLEIVKGIVESAEHKGADAVIGSRAIAKEGYEGYTFLRKLMSRAYLVLVRLLTGFKHSDSQCGIKCFSKRTAHDVFNRMTLDGFSFDLEALMLCDRLGYKVCEHPAVIINHRESKIRPFRDAMRMIRDIRTIKRNFRQNVYGLK